MSGLVIALVAFTVGLAVGLCVEFDGRSESDS